MSSIYVSEPPTRGKVVVKTTMGPIDIEFWPKEAPKAVRNFVQLCLEGYYDRTIFHRVIKSFLVQGGDPTASGTGGESIYGSVFADEFHSRLRFNHRGIVACANAGSPHSNGSQFFITLDRCDWIDRKNTIFGKVTGDSIFNLLRLGDVETDKDDRPVDPPPKILSVEVLWNPFDDIVPRQVVGKSATLPKIDEEIRDQKQKAVKKLNVLSFGDEVEEDEKEAETANVNGKIKSIHDVLDDPRFIKNEPEKDELVSSVEVEKRKEIQMSVREALNSKKGSSKDKEIGPSNAYNHSDGDDDDGDEAKFDTRMRLQILKKRKELGDNGSREKISKDKVNRKDQRIPSPRSNGEDNQKQASKVDKLSLKKKGIGSEAKADNLAKSATDLQLLPDADRERELQKLKKRRLHGREEDTLAKLERFKKSVSKRVEPDRVPSKDNDEDESEWMANRLTFIRDSSQKDGMARTNDPNEYVVHDPLLEKGKEKFNKMQAKLKRRDREWAGKSLT